MLTYSCVYCYKHRRETDSTSSKQASSNPDFTSGLTPARARLKKAMKKRFKVVDGVEFFEVHRGEWFRSDSSPVGPSKTYQPHGFIERHWVWTCPGWSDRMSQSGRQHRVFKKVGWIGSPKVPRGSRKTHQMARDCGGLGSPRGARPVRVCIRMLGLNMEARHTSLVCNPPQEVR